MNLTSSGKFAVTSSAALAAVGVSLVIFFMLSRYVSTSAARFEEIEFRISTLEEERKFADLAKNFLVERAGDLERVRRFSPNRERPVELIEAFEALARKTGNSSVLDFDEEKSKTAGLVFRVTVDGTEKNIRRYLKLLELMPYQISVEDLTFQQLASTGESALKKASGVPVTHRLILALNVKTFL